MTKLHWRNNQRKLERLNKPKSQLRYSPPSIFLNFDIYRNVSFSFDFMTTNVFWSLRVACRFFKPWKGTALWIPSPRTGWALSRYRNPLLFKLSSWNISHSLCLYFTQYFLFVYKPKGKRWSSFGWFRQFGFLLCWQSREYYRINWKVLPIAFVPCVCILHSSFIVFSYCLPASLLVLASLMKRSGVTPLKELSGNLTKLWNQSLNILSMVQQQYIQPLFLLLSSLSLYLSMFFSSHVLNHIKLFSFFRFNQRCQCPSAQHAWVLQRNSRALPQWTDLQLCASGSCCHSTQHHVF